MSGKEASFLSREETAATITDMYSPSLDSSARNRAFCRLWDSYEAFVKQLARTTFNDYYSHEKKEDLDSIMMNCLWVNSRDYNPLAGAYTTYIKPYLLHDVSIYIAREWWGLSSYYGSIYKKIVLAQNSLIAEGKEISLPALREKTGLSAHTINKCLSQIPCRITDREILEDFDNLAADETAPTPEAVILENEQVSIIRKCVWELPDDQRRVIVMYCGFGDARYTVTEISRMLGLTKYYVGKLLQEACLNLRKSLVSECLIEP